MSTPFVGRREELEALAGLASAARSDGVPTVGLIVGEPGSGKSRLLREAIARVDPARLVQAVGFEPMASIPLAAMGDLVRRLGTVPEHGPRLEALAFGTTELRDQSVLAMFEAAHRAHASFGLLVLAVDDLQWLDSRSIALVLYLVSAAASNRLPIIVIAASRPSPATIAFGEGVASAVPGDRRVSIELGGLPMRDGVALVQAIDERLDRRSAEELWRRAAGSPFWLEALSREGGSRDVVSLLTGRLRALSADAGSLLNTLAIAGRPFAHKGLAEVASWSSGRLDHAVGELVGRGLAVSQAGSVRLSHDLIRETTARLIPPPTARGLHRRFAEVLEQGDDVYVLAEALEHREAADVDRSGLALRLVASSQRRRLGREQLGQLSAIADGLESGSARQLELDVGIGQLANELWERQIAIHHWGRAARVATDHRLRQRAHVEAARAGYESGSTRAIHRHIAAARALPLDTVTAMELDTIEANVWMWDELDTPRGVAAAGRAMEHVRKLWSDPEHLLQLTAETRAAMLAAVIAEGQAAQRQDRPAELLGGLEMATVLANGLGDEAWIAAQIHAGFAYFKLGRLAEAAEAYRAAWQMAGRLILPRSMIEASVYLARVLRGLGRLAEAQVIGREGDAIQGRLRDWLWGEWSGTELNLIDLSLGDLGAADRIRDDIEGLGAHYRLSVHQALAAWAARRDGPQRALEVERELAAARQQSVIVDCPACARELRVVSAELLARVGRVDEAQLELDAWDADYSGPSYLARDLWRARALASIELARASPEAVASLQTLITALDRAGRLEESIWATLDLGQALKRSGDRAGAIAAYTAAAVRADEIRASGLARLAARGLRELGVRAWRRGVSTETRDGIAALSNREREVAHLVARGASNREISEALVLSPKTVERHLTNILAKVGARNRTELASVIVGGAAAGPTA